MESRQRHPLRVNLQCMSFVKDHGKVVDVVKDHGKAERESYEMFQSPLCGTANLLTGAGTFL